MASKAGASSSALEALIARAAGSGRRPAPVERWNPPDCGSIDIRIDREGGWHYLGTPIGREALVRLFSTVLRRDPDGFYLVTPVEKLKIEVEDVPFVAVEMEVEADNGGQTLVFRTNVGDVVRAGPDHPIRFETEVGRGDLRPYVHIRGGLEARLSRPLLYQLAEHLSERDGAVGVVSGGSFFAAESSTI